MPTGSLRLALSDTVGDPIQGRTRVDFDPSPSSAGGAAMRVTFLLTDETEIHITDLECRGGPGTLYTVRLTTPNFKSFAFFQMILEDRMNTPSESPARLVVKPDRVKDIRAPRFAQMPAAARGLLDSAQMLSVEPGDSDLVGLSGQALYDAMGPFRKAAFLNIVTKAMHTSSEECLSFVESLTLVRQDRCFCIVDDGMPEFLRKSKKFKSAPDILHDPLPQFTLEDSFKSRDAHANLQVTFMRNRNSGELRADIDIDESAGLEHGFEVIRNAFQGRTNPYLVRELLCLADPVRLSLDPGYRFVLD